MDESSKSRPVLILGAAPRIAVPVARSLHRHGIPVEVASFQPEEPTLRSRAISYFHRLPVKEKDSPAFANSFLSLIRERHFDMVIPAGDPALAVLAEYYHELTGMLHVGCPAPHAVERVLNKSLTLEAARQCGITVPASCTVATGAELESVASSLRFPIVAKPSKKGGKAFRVQYFHTLQDLSAAMESDQLGVALLQEYWSGVGLGVEMLVHGGECLAVFQHRRLKEAPSTGGVAVMAISEEPDPALTEAALQLLRRLEWEGVAMVEFRVDRIRGTIVLLEVNGRYWGSSSLPILAGVDFPFYHWQMVHGEKPQVPHRYPIGLRWRWLPGYLERLHGLIGRSGTRIGPPPSRVSELLQVPADLSPAICEALWSWTDPVPFFADLAKSLRAFATADLAWWARKCMPAHWRTYANIYFRLGDRARPIYARLRVRDALGLGLSQRHRPPQGARSFLFVCYGNIMRSPMAEAMLKRVLAEHGLNNVRVSSAGLHALTGREAHPRAVAVGREIGIALDHHRAQLLTPTLVAGTDAIVAMDFENLAELQALYPEAEQRTCLLSAYANPPERFREIPDPYFGTEQSTRRCYAVLASCIRNLVASLLAESETEGVRTQHSISV
jgi:protein-tyrosine-phosphatase/predicted ATP-grasp superfamily ATP-dependent carboligase